MCQREKETAQKTEGLNDSVLNCIGSFSISYVLKRYPASILSKLSLSKSHLPKQISGTFLQ